MASSGEAQWIREDGGPERHIKPALQSTQERHQPRIIAPASFRFVRIGKLALGQSLGLHLQIDFCIDVGGIDRNVSEPSPNRVDGHAGTEKMGSGRVANRVRADPLCRQRRHPNQGLANVPFDERVDAETGDGVTTAIEEDTRRRRAAGEER